MRVVPIPICLRIRRLGVRIPPSAPSGSELSVPGGLVTRSLRERWPQSEEQESRSSPNLFVGFWKAFA